MKISKTTLTIKNGQLVNKMAWSRALKASRIPLYAFSPLEKRNILKIYIKAQVLNFAQKLTKGRKYEVDHIIPLNSHFICGLHVSSNLQVITQLKNTNKSNFFTPYREINSKKFYFTELKSGTPFKKRKKTKTSVQKMAKKRLKIPKNSTKLVIKRKPKTARKP